MRSENQRSVNLVEKKKKVENNEEKMVKEKITKNTAKVIFTALKRKIIL